VVDDERDTAESTAALLASHGFRATCAFGGVEAIAAASADPPDVALISLAVPPTDGYEVARRLRALHPLRPPILIAVTGLTESWNQDRAAAAGFMVYLVKPVPPAELVSLLKQCEESLAPKA
jgi:CheY-like chemotaxis protein